MNERRSEMPHDAREFRIGPHQKGLCAAYLKAKNETERQAAIAKMYKDAIAVRADGLSGGYSQYVQEMKTHILPARSEHPVASNRRHLAHKPKRYTDTYTINLVSEDGKQQRRVVYKEIISGSKVEESMVRIERPDRPVKFKSLNLLTGQFEMRDSRHVLVLAHNEPKVIDLTHDANSHSHADILDSFEDELKLLQSLKNLSQHPAI